MWWLGWIGTYESDRTGHGAHDGGALRLDDRRGVETTRRLTFSGGVVPDEASVCGLRSVLRGSGAIRVRVVCGGNADAMYGWLGILLELNGRAERGREEVLGRWNARVGGRGWGGS